MTTEPENPTTPEPASGPQPGQLKPWNASDQARAAKITATDRHRTLARVRPAVREMLQAEGVPTEDAQADEAKEINDE